MERSWENCRPFFRELQLDETFRRDETRALEGEGVVGGDIFEVVRGFHCHVDDTDHFLREEVERRKRILVDQHRIRVLDNELVVIHNRRPDEQRVLGPCQRDLQKSLLRNLLRRRDHQVSRFNNAVFQSFRMDAHSRRIRVFNVVVIKASPVGKINVDLAVLWHEVTGCEREIIVHENVP